MKMELYQGGQSDIHHCYRKLGKERLAVWDLFSTEVFIYLNSVLLRETPQNICSIHGGFGEEQILTLTSKYFHSIETERKEPTSRKMANCIENNWAIVGTHQIAKYFTFPKTYSNRDFPGGSMVRTSPSSEGVPIRYLAGELHASWSKNQNIK